MLLLARRGLRFTIASMSRRGAGTGRAPNLQDIVHPRQAPCSLDLLSPCVASIFAGRPAPIAAVLNRGLEYKGAGMANDQTADEVLASLVEYVGAQMLRVEELSRRSGATCWWRRRSQAANWAPTCVSATCRPTECRRSA